MRDFLDALEPQNPIEDLIVNCDEDLLKATLLFLDQADAVTSSEPHSTLTASTGPNTELNDSSQENDRPAFQRLRDIRPRCTVGTNLRQPQPQRTIPVRRRVNKQRVEIEALRNKARALQMRIMTLKHKSSTNGPKNAGLFMIAPLGSTWEDVALQELKERERAEAERQRLKELLSEHKRIAMALQQAATQKMDHQAQELVRLASPCPPTPPGFGSSLQDPRVMQVLTEALRPMVDQTDLVLSSTLGRTLSTARHGDSHLTIQIQDARIVPVGVATTVSVMWEHALFQDDLKQVRWKRLSDDTFQSEFVSHAEFPGFRGQALGKLTVLRVEQANRTVIVRSSVFECQAGKNRFLVRPMRHFLWIVIDRPPHLSVIPGEDAISRVRTCAISLPRLDVGDFNDPGRDAEIDDLLQLSTVISTRLCDQAIDSMDERLLGRHNSNSRQQSPSNIFSPIVQNIC